MSKLVTYDLCAPGKDYSNLINAIKAYSDWCKIAESCYVISSADTCVIIRDNLKKHIDSNDRLFVGSLSGEAAWTKVMCSDDNLKRVINK